MANKVYITELWLLLVLPHCKQLTTNQCADWKAGLCHPMALAFLCIFKPLFLIRVFPRMVDFPLQGTKSEHNVNLSGFNATSFSFPSFIPALRDERANMPPDSFEVTTDT